MRVHTKTPRRFFVALPDNRIIITPFLCKSDDPLSTCERSVRAGKNINVARAQNLFQANRSLAASHDIVLFHRRLLYIHCHYVTTYVKQTRERSTDRSIERFCPISSTVPPCFYIIQAVRDPYTHTHNAMVNPWDSVRVVIVTRQYSSRTRTLHASSTRKRSPFNQLPMRGIENSIRNGWIRTLQILLGLHIFARHIKIDWMQFWLTHKHVLTLETHKLLFKTDRVSV